MGGVELNDGLSRDRVHRELLSVFQELEGKAISVDDLRTLPRVAARYFRSIAEVIGVDMGVARGEVVGDDKILELYRSLVYVLRLLEMTDAMPYCLVCFFYEVGNRCRGWKDKSAQRVSDSVSKGVDATIGEVFQDGGAGKRMLSFDERGGPEDKKRQLLDFFDEMRGKTVAQMNCSVNGGESVLIRFARFLGIEVGNISENGVLTPVGIIQIKSRWKAQWESTYSRVMNRGDVPSWLLK